MGGRLNIKKLTLGAISNIQGWGAYSQEEAKIIFCVRIIAVTFFLLHIHLIRYIPVSLM